MSDDTFKTVMIILIVSLLLQATVYVVWTLDKSRKKQSPVTCVETK
ncbi:hypothetical protein UFOVP602_13 [uncultured Caudovirales phage]|jgi:uncharacterized membrane protein YqjE|uniref:Uncharacterized protein n=1 Tax=uncultured Caudovirales phage TaxID=2100421 RepID=A0A6J5N5M8_9CAUD|nr:hypothetical protein UFOVP602_13 [uncultured Caudovirales phage]